MELGIWDGALLVAVTAQCTVIAYLHEPKWKALVMSLPVPFTMGSLALGEPLDVTHAVGLMLLLGFMNLVRWLHYNRSVSIIPAIATAACGYALSAALLASALPRDAGAFWVASALTVGTAWVLRNRTLRPLEPGQRTPLPLWKKLPVIAAVIISIIMLKHLLCGFMATFPMVSVVTVYEARYSLRTVCWQAAAMLLAFVPMQVIVHLFEGPCGIGWAFAAGWTVFLAVLTGLAWQMWFRSAPVPCAQGGGPSAP